MNLCAKMRIVYIYLFAIVCSIGFISCSTARQFQGIQGGLSPYDFCLSDAKTDAERYNVLLKTHLAAVKTGVNVDYRGIDTVRIEISENASSIPLTQYNDFNGCVFVVKNTTKDSWLFGNVVNGIPVTVTKQMIDTGNFRTVDALRRGRYLLIIEDEKPWVENRIGYSYGHSRKDILLIENGLAKNDVVMPYNNVNSIPKCKAVKLGDKPLVVKNLIIERDPNCTSLTHIANISGHDDVRIQNVSIHTPPSELANDRGILIRNCTNVTFDEVRIDGTYSRKNHSGYGVFLDNIWNFKAIKMYAKANWGIFGNNNINTAMIEDSQINRFDIHCYGKNVSFTRCKFTGLYNQFSSVFGLIKYQKCEFREFIPILIESSYNAYTPFDVVWDDCHFNFDSKHNYLMTLSGVSQQYNSRPELRRKCLPNITVKNCTVNMTQDISKWYILHTGGINYKDSFDYISNITLKNVKIRGNSNSKFDLFTENLKTTNSLSSLIKGVSIQ